jgi:hypothetical protein
MMQGSIKIGTIDYRGRPALQQIHLNGFTGPFREVQAQAGLDMGHLVFDSRKGV